MINCVYLLRMVHSASRQGAPGLELLGKITDTEAEAREQLRDNTAFGFLAALVGWQCLVNFTPDLMYR